jgi:predicted Zn-dependent protease
MPICNLPLYLLILTFFAGCAVNPQREETYWNVAACSRTATTSAAVITNDPSTIPLVVARESCAAAEKAAARIQKVANLELAQLLVSDSEGLNAFATTDKNQKPVVVVSAGMLAALKTDEDAWAALLGHEIAHHALNHRSGRSLALTGAQGVGHALGQAVALLVPGVGGWIAGNATSFATTNAVYGSYTRPQERESDEAGLRWMVAAGYDPRGMERLLTKLRTSSSSAMPDFLSTHPGARDRAQMVREFIEKRHSRK